MHVSPKRFAHKDVVVLSRLVCGGRVGYDLVELLLEMGVRDDEVLSDGP